MKPEELDDLILGQLEGRSTAQERRRLDESLIADPEVGRRYADLAVQEGLLSDLAEAEELGAAASDAKTSSSTGIRRLRSFRHRTRPPSTAWWAWAAAAAAFMLVVGFVLTGRGESNRPREAVTQAPEPAPLPEPPRMEIPDLDPPAIRRVLAKPEGVPPPPAPQPVPPPPPAPPPGLPPPEPPPTPPRESVPTLIAVARMVRMEGAVEIGRSSGQPGRQITAGETIQTGGRDSFATLAYPDGTLLDLDPGSVLTVGPVRTVELKQGRVSAVVAKQPPGQAFRLTTPQAEARVLGTRLILAADARATRLDVTEGRVRLTRTSDGAAADVAANHYAVAGAGLPLAPKPIPPLFLDPFDASPLNDWPKGWLKHETEAPRRSAWRVLQDPARIRERFIGCPPAVGGLTQHAVLPIEEWPASFAVSFRLRLGGTRVTRAGIEIADGRLDPSFEYDAQASVVRVDWPRNKALKQTPLTIPPGAWTDWTITVEGTRFRVAVDRKPVLDVELPDYGRVRGASLVSRGADSAQFDDVKVVRR